MAKVHPLGISGLQPYARPHPEVGKTKWENEAGRCTCHVCCWLLGDKEKGLREECLGQPPMGLVPDLRSTAISFRDT